jgi:hypothetical protein
MAGRGGTWFRCLAEVPGSGYPGDPARRSRLRERDAVPEVMTFSLGGERVVSLSWPSPEGRTSASPVHRLAFGDHQNESSAQARERVLTALELPGEIMDYHFAMQGVLDLLYKRRRAEPQHLPFVEWLAWLDVQLVEAHSKLFRISPGKEEYFAITAFDLLVGLYEREGYLHDALAAAERFVRFQRDTETVAELRARVAQLRAEHA